MAKAIKNWKETCDKLVENPHFSDFYVDGKLQYGTNVPYYGTRLCGTVLFLVRRRDIASGRATF